MKSYQNPQLEIIELANADIVTLSVNATGSGEDWDLGLEL